MKEAHTETVPLPFKPRPGSILIENVFSLAGM